ncbi:MAG: Ribosomal RNA small subunit methyltransferase H [Acidimicrobiales bacterium AG-410-I20]|nr:MAG: Ribosomal RNA small subunit methyltransferase H [Acidimicrobiales bacterium AG-410-I20]
MTEEVCSALLDVPSGVILDATVGGGGHTLALLELRDDWKVVGIDRDQIAIEAAGKKTSGYEGRCILRQSEFVDFPKVLKELAINELSGFVFDLGVSSVHFDVADRGFSYTKEGPLDMRMDQQQSLTAHEVINEYPEPELNRIIKMYGDERFSRRITTAIANQRPITNTLDLAEIIKSAIPAPARRSGGHPAKRTFQAVRIEVNSELKQLSGTLMEAVKWLAPKGRGVVLSYHSGEDRIVKKIFREAEDGGCICPSRLPCVCGAISLAKAVNKKVINPSSEEVTNNHRSSSALFRAIERLHPDESGTES